VVNMTVNQNVGLLSWFIFILCLLATSTGHLSNSSERLSNPNLLEFKVQTLLEHICKSPVKLKYVLTCLKNLIRIPK